MTAPKPVAPKPLSYTPPQKPAKKLTREERRNGVQDRKPKGMKETLIEAAEATAEAPKPTPVKKPFELQPHLTHRPFAGLKHKLK